MNVFLYLSIFFASIVVGQLLRGLIGIGCKKCGNDLKTVEEKKTRFCESHYDEVIC